MSIILGQYIIKKVLLVRRIESSFVTKLHELKNMFSYMVIVYDKNLYGKFSLQKRLIISFNETKC